MKVVLDGRTYTLNLTRVSEYLQAFYEANKHVVDTIHLENGKTIDFSRKSVIRIGAKALLSQQLLGVLGFIYKSRGVELPKHERHEDFFDYFIRNALGIFGLFDNEGIYVSSIEVAESDSRIVDSVSTKPQEDTPQRIGDGRTEEEEKETKDNSTRGETSLHSGKERHGENETY